jgi:hypothetical protein
MNKHYIYKFLLYILNDFIPMTDKNYLSSGIFSDKLTIFYLILKDLNVFSEKKTNLGLFVLKNNLNLKLFCTGAGILSNRILLRI